MATNGSTKNTESTEPQAEVEGEDPEQVSVLFKTSRETRANLKALSGIFDVSVNDYLNRLVDADQERNRGILDALAKAKAEVGAA